MRNCAGLLVQGKSDFDTIKNFRSDKFYIQALDIALLPSSPALRQRMDALALEMFDIGGPMIESAAQRPESGLRRAAMWLAALNADTFAMDNGGGAVEGMGHSCASADGYCPLTAYLGLHGFCLELALRPGVLHSASESDVNLGHVVPMAQHLRVAGTKGPMVAHLCARFDSVRLMGESEAYDRTGLPQGDWLIKWSTRKADVVAVAARLDAHAPPRTWRNDTRVSA